MLDAAYVDAMAADAIKIGCGTGLLSLRLAPHVSSILAIDAAEGIIDALTQKLARPENDGVKQKNHPLYVILEDQKTDAYHPQTASSRVILQASLIYTLHTLRSGHTSYETSRFGL